MGRVLLLGAVVAAIVTAVAGPAGAAGGAQAVSVTANEDFALGSTFTASGGIFGSGTEGVFFSTFEAQPIGETSRQITRGEDTLISTEGTITWSFVARCVAAFPAVTCDGSWHVTEATGAYAGAHGAGTLHGELNLLGGIAGTGTDTFTGRIVQT
jgi:hypothetical protein